MILVVNNNFQNKLLVIILIIYKDLFNNIHLPFKL